MSNKKNEKTCCSGKLKSHIKELEASVAAEKNKAIRALADLENLRRRESENKKNWTASGIAYFLKELLPNFFELQLGKEHSSDKELIKVIDKFFGKLEKLGFQKIAPKKGDNIDSGLHEVLLTEEGRKGAVIRTLEPGWKFGEIVIAPAKVSASAE